MAPQLASALTIMAADEMKPKPVVESPVASTAVTGCLRFRVPGGTQARVYYPAELTAEKAVKTPWMKDFKRFALGHLSVVRVISTRLCGAPEFIFEILGGIFRFIAALMPSYHFVPKLPNTYNSLEPRSPAAHSYPLVVWSHGLTGNGDENAKLCSDLTRMIEGGAIVIQLHHEDGSCCEAITAEGKEIEFMPDPSDYPRDFRPKQVRQRAEEMSATVKYFLSLSSSPSPSAPLLSRVASVVDSRRIVPGGFSFGGATTAEFCSTVGSSLVADGHVPCAVLLDPWTFVEPPQRTGVDGFRFPETAQIEGIQTPTLILATEQFTVDFPLMRSATANLHDKSHDDSKLVILPDTQHLNLQEIYYWAPEMFHVILKKVRFLHENTVSARGTYMGVVETIANFVSEHAAHKLR